MKKYQTNSNHNLDGVVVKHLKKNADDRGFLTEVLRNDDNLLKKFGQLTFTAAFPGVIKAFHYHKRQDDFWFCPFGNIQIVLFDLREKSSTYHQKQVVFAGENNFVSLLIPRGIAHGYKVLGNKEAGLFYATSESYDRHNPDEFRLDFDDPLIAADWETKNR